MSDLRQRREGRPDVGLLADQLVAALRNGAARGGFPSLLATFDVWPGLTEDDYQALAIVLARRVVDKRTARTLSSGGGPFG